MVFKLRADFSYIFHSSNRSSTTDITKLNSNKFTIKNAISSPSPYTAGNESRKEIACQTLSTGDIVMMKVFFEEDKQTESTLMSSPKKEK